MAEEGCNGQRTALEFPILAARLLFSRFSLGDKSREIQAEWFYLSHFRIFHMSSWQQFFAAALITVDGIASKLVPNDMCR